MKTSRQAVILEIIAEQDIETQGQLLEALEARGVQSTQATVSRDIKELRLVKEIAPDGNYRYAPAGIDADSEAARRLEGIFRDACVTFDYALHTVVIRTRKVAVNAVCVDRFCAKLLKRLANSSFAGTASAADPDNSSHTSVLHNMTVPFMNMTSHGTCRFG